ncbi:MAG: hypothetical protein KF779_09005 [Hyphomonadaceae bacterium]|nr:hypothetical protein [Hyphomonadaceae bacterium]
MACHLRRSRVRAPYDRYPCATLLQSLFPVGGFEIGLHTHVGAAIFIPIVAFEAQASYVRITKVTGSLYARLTGWFGILPFTQRINLSEIASLRAGHVTTRKSSNTQTGVHISSNTRYELILSGSFGARRLQFGSAEARDLTISVIQAWKRDHGSEAQESNELADG